MGITISRANAADIPDWAAMRADLWVDASLAEHAEEAAAALQRDNAAGLALIARDQAGGAVGFAEAALRRDYVNGCDTSPVGFLEGIWVAPALRRTGLARRFVEQVERWARTLGCCELASDTDWENPEGIAFHLGAGFEETERVIFFRKTI